MLSWANYPLTGSLQAVKGVLPIAIHAKKEGFKGIILPYQNANEAAVVQDFEVYGFRHISEVIAFLKKEKTFPPWNSTGKSWSKIQTTSYWILRMSKDKRT